nr:MAG TPA: hypothetical protein [Caudoviricetes sp.]
MPPRFKTCSTRAPLRSRLPMAPSPWLPHRSATRSAWCNCPPAPKSTVCA